MAKKDRKEYEENLNYLLKTVGLVDKRNSLPKQLSGGQQQRVLIARALCATKKIIVLDEPTNGLDPSIAKQIYELLDKLKKDPIDFDSVFVSPLTRTIQTYFLVKDSLNKNTQVYITDFVREVLSYCDKNKGKDDYSPLQMSIKNNNAEIVHILMDYYREHELPVPWNEIDQRGCYTLVKIINDNNFDLIKSLVKKNDQNGNNETGFPIMIKNMNKKNKYGNFLLMDVIKHGNGKLIEFLFRLADDHNILLNLNDKDKKGNFPLLEAAHRKDDITLTKLLFQYATDHHFLLSINDKNNYKVFPVLIATMKENKEFLKLLIEYANHHTLLLNIMEKDKKGIDPMSMAIMKNNNEIVELLINYFKDHEYEYNLNDKNLGNPLFNLETLLKDKIVEILYQMEKLQNFFNLQFNNRVPISSRLKNPLYNNQKETKPLTWTNSASLIPVIFFNSSLLFPLHSIGKGFLNSMQ